MPAEDKIKDAFSTIKNTGVFIDEDDFREQLKANPKEVFDIFNQTKDTKGIFIDFEDFNQSLDVGKPLTAPLPGDGGGLSSGMTPGMDGGKSEFGIERIGERVSKEASLYDISSILKGAGIDSLPEDDDIEVTQKKVEGPALKTITDVSGKPVKLEVTETEVKAEPTPALQPFVEEEAGAKMPSMGLDMATLMPETDKQYKTLEFSGKKVFNPFVNLKENVDKINKEQDTEKRSYEYGKLYDNIIDYNNSLIENMDVQAATIQEYAKNNADQLNQINQQLQDPNIPNEQKIQLEQNASQLTANLLGSEDQLKTIETNRAKNIEQNNKLNTYKNLLDYNLDTWEILLGSTYNASVVSLFNGLNNLNKFANSIKYDIYGLVMPIMTDKATAETFDKYKEVFKNNDYNKIAADNVSQLIDKITYKADISRNPGLDKALTDDLNKANVANFLGSLLGSVGSTMAGGGATIALQAFGGMYNVGKEAGLNDTQAGLFSIPIAVVAGYLAPLGTEKFLSKIASKTGKQQLITAIKGFGANTPTQLWNKSMDYAKGVAKGILEEGAEGFSEQATEEASRKVTEMFTGVDLSKDSFYQSFTNSFENGFIEASGGGILQLGLGLVPGMKYGKLSRIVTEAMTNPKAEQTTMTDLQNAYRSNKITEQQYNTAVSIFNKAKQATTQLPPNVKDPRAIAKSVQLILNQEEVQQKLETVNPAMREGLDKELKDINQQLADLAGGKVPDVMPDEEKVIKESPKEKETAPVEEVKAEVTVAEPLKDVPNTTDALNKKKTELGESSDTWQSVADLVPEGSYGIVDGVDTGKTISDVISETYHADKSAEKETELTKAVEELLAKPAEAAPTEAAAQPTLEDFDVINMTSVKGRKAREELKARVGADAYKKMDMVNKKFEETIKDLENKGILRKECP